MADIYTETDSFLILFNSWDLEVIIEDDQTLVACIFFTAY